jgi:hypothetical protein
VESFQNTARRKAGKHLQQKGFASGSAATSGAVTKEWIGGKLPGFGGRKSTIFWDDSIRAQSEIAPILGLFCGMFHVELLVECQPTRKLFHVKQLADLGWIPLLCSTWNKLLSPSS